MELKKKEQENKLSSASNADRSAEAEPATVPRCNEDDGWTAAEAGTAATELSNAFPAAATTTESNVNEFTWKSNAQILIRAGKGKTKVENQIVNLWPFQPFRAMLLLS